MFSTIKRIVSTGNNIREEKVVKNNCSPEIKLTVVDHAVKYSISDGWSAEFIGADFPQLVDDSLHVHTPLCDTTAVLSFKCRKSNLTAEKDIRLSLKGQFGAPDKKPNVIPEPAQWHAAGKGKVLKTIGTYSCSEELKQAASDFAKDYLYVTDKKIEYANPSDVEFLLDSNLSYLGDEGYEIECDGSHIVVKACAEIGCIWAGKTICQLMLQGGFPGGIMRDYPRYSVRGFMLDVGRRPVSMDMLKRVVEHMAWYKMNDFQIHLGDNYIWLEDYAQNGDESTFDAYQAFRLESALKNDKGETATAKDYFYKKDEFNHFIKKSLQKGVHITPEIDMPAHALAFTKVFPEYAVMGEVSTLMKKRPLTDHINIARPEAVEFVKRIFDDYIKGDDPVFPKGTTVHIGADEFLSDYGAYRRFINEIIPYIKQTHSVRLWGSLTWIKDNPATPIVKEAVDGVQMNLWSSSWADGREMYDMGYDLVNTIDFSLYMVPNGTKIRAPYMDYINKRKVFQSFEPNKVRLKDKGKLVDLPAGNKQLLGSCYAIWQDNIDKRSKGMTEFDLYDRFADSAALLAEKNWGSCTDKQSSKQIDDMDSILNPSVFRKKASFRSVQDITLTGGECFVETECKNLEVGAKLQIDLQFDEIVPGQILMEADAPYGTYDVRITENNKLGFTAECYEYEFDYELTANKRISLLIDTKPLRTVLKTGLLSRKKAVGSYSFDGIVRKNNIKNTSFRIPVQRIGSKTNSVKAHIYNIRIK